MRSQNEQPTIARARPGGELTSPTVEVAVPVAVDETVSGVGEFKGSSVEDRGTVEHEAPDRSDQSADSSGSAHLAVRVLPRQVVRDVIEATGPVPGSARLPKLFRPERLDDLTDVARLLRLGEPVVLQVDRLDECDQLRAMDVATGIALALNATMSKLESMPGVTMSPRRHTAGGAVRAKASRGFRALLRSRARNPQRARQPTLCAVRASTVDHRVRSSARSGAQTRRSA